MKKSQFSHWVLPLATVCNMMSFSSAFAQEYDFSLQGYFNPSCGGGFFERVEQEGMPFQFDVDLSIDFLMGEPVVRSSAIWNPYGFGVSCIEPYNQDGLVRLTNLRQYDPEGKSHPYNMDLVAELVGPSIQGQTFLSFNPGALSATAGEEGYNTSGSPNWNRFLFMMPSGSFDFWNTDLYQYLPADAAKEIFRSGFSVSEVTVADVDFDMSAAKSNFGMRAKTANTLETVANRLADWGSDTFEAYPEEVAQRIKTDAALPVPENSAALRQTIDDIQALHRNLVQKGGKENVQATMDALHENLQPFLQAMDVPETKEEFWQIHFKSEMDAAQKERETIAAEIAANALETNAKPERPTITEDTPATVKHVEIDYKYEAGTLARWLENIAIDGIFETDCGKAGNKVHESVVDEKTGENILKVGLATPVCGSAEYKDRMSEFRFLVSDITAYDISGYVLTIEFAGLSVSEHYYETDYRDSHDERRPDLVLMINVKHDLGIDYVVKSLDKLVRNRPN